MLDKRTFGKYLELQGEIEQAKANLVKFQSQVDMMQSDVEASIQDVAARLLIDDNGNPVDGGVYWYSGLAIVRLGEIVTVIPMKTTDYNEMFPKEAKG